MARNYASIPLPASGDLLPCSGKLKSICAQRFRFPMSSRSQTKADAFRFLFLRARQDCLKMRRLFFARDDADFDFFETRFFQPTMQIAFRKTEPAVAVKFVRLLEVVLQQTQNHDLPAAAENPVRRANHD